MNDEQAAAGRRPTTLDDLVIRASSHTPFFGVYLATHAIPDALCMCHASVGCKVKTQHHLVGHDGVADAHNRMRYSQFIDEDLIQGSTEQLEEEIVAFQARRGSQIVVIDSSTPISLQGMSLAPVCERLEAKTGVDVVAVDARNYDADLWQGYDAAMATILARQRWGALDATADDEVAIVGYPFDRYEPDHSGTIAELRRLLYGIGLKARAVWLAGEPYETLRQITEARHVVLLPWAQERTEKALRAAGRAPIRAGLPMGLDGTAAWLRAVASATGGEARLAVAERVLRHERARVKPLYALAHRRLAGRRFAAFADAPRLAGLVALLGEVGMAPRCLGTSHFSLGRPDDVVAALATDFGRAPLEGVRWLDDPTPEAQRALARELADFMRRYGRGGPRPAPPPGDGSAADAAVAGRAPADPAALPALAGVDVVVGTTLDRDQLEEAGLPFVEFGYPSERHHALFPAPWLGPNGALRLLERVLAALEMRDERG